MLASERAAALAQAILAGNWNSVRTHEDEQDRGPGPDLGDYSRAADQQRGAAVCRQLGRLAADAAGAPVPRARGALHLPRPAATCGSGRRRIPRRSSVIAIKNYISTYEQTRTIWMDGRPHPSRVRAAHVHGLLDRHVGRPRADGHHHASEAGLAAPQRRARERSDDALSSASSRHGSYLTHIGDHHRPGVSGRADDPHHRLSVVNEQDGGNWLWPCEYVEEISGRAKGEVPHYLPGANPFLQGVRRRAPARRWRPCAAAPTTIYPEYQAKLKAAPRRREQQPRRRASVRRRIPTPASSQLLPVQGNVYLLAGARRQRRRAGGPVGRDPGGLEVRPR